MTRVRNRRKPVGGGNGSSHGRCVYEKYVLFLEAHTLSLPVANTVHIESSYDAQGIPQTRDSWPEDGPECNEPAGLFFLVPVSLRKTDQIRRVLELLLRRV